MQDTIYPILVDDRVGSRDIVDDGYLDTLGVPYELTRIQSGDFAITGYGSDGLTMIGIERKRVDDLIASIDGGRVTNAQLVTMDDFYQVRYLLIEGMHRLGRDNTIEKVVGNSFLPCVNRNMTYTRLLGSLIHIQQTGVKLVYTNTSYETAVALRAIHSWWSKPWHEHEYQEVYTAHKLDGAARTSQGLLRYRDLADPAKLLWRWAQDLPGVMSKAAEFVVKFKTAQNLANANLSDIEEVVGKGKTARKILEVIRGKAV
jgi:ERCC4-type nuclease